MEQTFTDQNFDAEVLKNELPVLVAFYADWCGPCKMMAPVVEELAKELAGKVTVGKLNVDENPQTAEKYGIMSIPTVILFKNGEAAKTLVGFKNKKEVLVEVS
ncbi:MAG TPA: thioredoxin [Patescibacteria group bacterium]|nr:thioredoxin [Patescibacteria group bacterium]